MKSANDEKIKEQVDKKQKSCRERRRGVCENKAREETKRSKSPHARKLGEWRRNPLCPRMGGRRGGRRKKESSEALKEGGRRAIVFYTIFSIFFSSSTLLTPHNSPPSPTTRRAQTPSPHFQSRLFKTLAEKLLRRGGKKLRRPGIKNARS
jgi:hypothetical protein